MAEGTVLLTGMRPEEMFEEIGNVWNVEPDGIRIHGTKSPAADRVVPRVGVLVKPATGRLASTATFGSRAEIR